MDIDLFYRGELDTAVLELQDLGIDDFFTFDIDRTPGQLATGTTGTSLTVVAYVGDKEFQRFSIDLVLIATTQQLDAHELRVALLSEYAHRDLDVPTRVELPDPSWVAG